MYIPALIMTPDFQWIDIQHIIIRCESDESGDTSRKDGSDNQAALLSQCMKQYKLVRNVPSK